MVAPLAGAWIEISMDTYPALACHTSHPSRVRGLKLVGIKASLMSVIVAPLAGAWIEI